MLTVFVLSLVALTAAFALCVRIGFVRRAEVAAATTTVWAALVLGPIYALAVPGLLTRRTLALTSLLVSVATLLASWNRGDPRFRRNFVAQARAVVAMPVEGLRLAARARSPLILGLLMCVVAFGWNLLAAYLSPSWRSWDALWYHEPIIGFTIQNHGFAVVDLPITPIQKINGYPRAGEMLSLWFAIFAGRRLIDLPNVLLMPGLMFAVYAACRRHTSDVLSCMGWAAVIVTIPAYVEELQTVFVDCALPVFISCGFLFCTSRPLLLRHAILAAISFALAASTKVSGVFPVTLLSLITAARLLVDRSMPPVRRVAAVLAGAAIVVGWSSVTYLRNLALFHNPIWPDLKIDVAALNIHWPGVSIWGPTSATSNPEQLNLSAPWGVMISELLTRPYGVMDPVRRYVFKFGLGVSWIVIPMIVVSGLVVVLRSLECVRRARTEFKRALRDLGEQGSGLIAVASIAVIYLSTSAIWAPRYNIHTLAIGVVLICCAFGRREWSSMNHAFIFATLVTALMNLWWDYPTWHSFPGPEMIWRLVETPYPDRELKPELGAPVNYEVALARERELAAGTTLVTDDFGFPSLLWNNAYSNRVVNVRDTADLAEAAERLSAVWIYAGTAQKTNALVATGKWEAIGPLFVEGWGTALRQKRL